MPHQSGKILIEMKILPIHGIISDIMLATINLISYFILLIFSLFFYRNHLVVNLFTTGHSILI